MKLKFDSNLEYQLEAIRSVTDLFEGLPAKQFIELTFMIFLDNGLLTHL